MKQRNNLIILSFVLAASLTISIFAQSYSVPSPISAYDVAVWTNRGSFIASGSASPTGIASEGALYADTTVATLPVLYRYGGSGWQPISGGTRKHSELEELAFADSGHTGFASEAAIPNNASFTLVGLGEKNFSSLTGKPTNASYTLSGLYEKDFANLTGKPTNASYTLTGLSEKNFASLTNKPTTLAGYGITDAALDASLTAHIATYDLHVADQVDPHGATMTVSDEITIGSGTITARIDNPEDGVVRIASYIQLVYATDTPVVSSSAITIFADNASKCVLLHDGNNWSNLCGTYGGIHAHDNATAQAIINGTAYATITALIDTHASNDVLISTSTQSIRINRGGVYRIAFSISYTTGTNNIVSKFAAFQNSTELDQVHTEVKTGTGADVASTGGSGFVRLSAGDIITLRARHDNISSVNYTVTYANLNVERVGN